MRTKCALVQMSFRDDKPTNVQRGADFVREAGRAGAEII
jgi:predicted amidohydrolase